MWNPNILNWPSWLGKNLQDGIEQIILEKKEEGSYPEHFPQSIDDVPAVRSLVLASDKEHPGWIFVESDLQTAEMRGKAIMSNDPNLKSIILDPDDNFAYVKPEFTDGDEDCKCRLKFPPELNTAENNKYLMTYTKKGKIIRTFTEDQLLRDATGNIVHPRHDIHFELAEASQSKPREILDKKKDRGTVGKIGNFCLVSNTSIITDNGSKYIGSLELDDRVWDGNSFVTHNGVVCHGRKLVIMYSGLTATPDHLVWTEKGIRTFLDAKLEKLNLLKASTYGSVIKVGNISSYLSPSLLDRRAEIASICAGEQKTIWELATENGYTLNLTQLKRFKEEDDILKEGRKEDVYDIVDAGPYKRFTANGYLVHNSTGYGATPETLARTISVGLGEVFEVEQAEAVLDAINKREPIATEFMMSLQNIPSTVGFYRAKSGRIRHCVTLGESEGISDWTRKSVLSAIGREMRNFPLQESVGATAARAINAILELCDKYKELQGYCCICLYDSLVNRCPPEERFIWEKINTLYFYLANGWQYETILRYPIDTEFNDRWSTSPPKFKKLVYRSPLYKGTPPHLKHIEDMLDKEIKRYTDNPSLSVYDPITNPTIQIN